MGLQNLQMPNLCFEVLSGLYFQMLNLPFCKEYSKEKTFFDLLLSPTIELRRKSLLKGWCWEPFIHLHKFCERVTCGLPSDHAATNTKRLVCRHPFPSHLMDRLGTSCSNMATSQKGNTRPLATNDFQWLPTRFVNRKEHQENGYQEFTSGRCMPKQHIVHFRANSCLKWWHLGHTDESDMTFEVGFKIGS